MRTPPAVYTEYVMNCLETIRSYEIIFIRNEDAYYTHGLARRSRIFDVDVRVHHIQEAGTVTATRAHIVTPETAT